MGLVRPSWKIQTPFFCHVSVDLPSQGISHCLIFPEQLHERAPPQAAPIKPTPRGFFPFPKLPGSPPLLVLCVDALQFSAETTSYYRPFFFPPQAFPPFRIFFRTKSQEPTRKSWMSYPPLMNMTTSCQVSGVFIDAPSCDFSNPNIRTGYRFTVLDPLYRLFFPPRHSLFPSIVSDSPSQNPVLCNFFSDRMHYTKILSIFFLSVSLDTSGFPFSFGEGAISLYLERPGSSFLLVLPFSIYPSSGPFLLDPSPFLRSFFNLFL